MKGVSHVSGIMERYCIWEEKTLPSGTLVIEFRSRAESLPAFSSSMSNFAGTFPMGPIVHDEISLSRFLEGATGLEGVHSGALRNWKTALRTLRKRRDSQASLVAA